MVPTARFSRLTWITGWEDTQIYLDLARPLQPANLINANLPVFTRLGVNAVVYPYADASPALPAVAG